jgi:uncharacterized OB-fold protein
VPGPAKRIPIQEGLFTWPSETPRLLASRCRACGELCFPRQDACPACTARDAEEVALGSRGRLWTFTIQRCPPPTPPWIGSTDPKRFVPFGVGYVELPEGIRVEGRLTENDPAELEIGMPMELVIEKFLDDAEGGELVTFAFRPVRD